MKTSFNIWKKRDGQDWKLAGSLMAESFDHAKKVFAKMQYDAYNNGDNGDNYHEENEESIQALREDGAGVSWYSEAGIYYDNNLVMAESLVVNGIDFWSEDVYCYTIDADRVQ